MSPLIVSQLLPSEQCFDVVIFDEASQIPPADAASSLMRAPQAVVAGDPKQLPPTTFFMSSDAEEDIDGDGSDDVTHAGADPAAAANLASARANALVADIESVLNVMSVLLPVPHGTRELRWHYRSLDERLITFSNAQRYLYDWSLVTFPGALAGNCISHAYVPFQIGQQGQSSSVSDEVDHVVQLVLEHAEQHSSESLGVITMGIKHANRIEEVLRQARTKRPDLIEFFAEDRYEPFFIKNLERVQGDERDAIILSIGYGMAADGRMRYHFGPINREGGERRLNVAVTRARRRLTLVSSFSSASMDSDVLGRLSNPIGPTMLRDYLRYAESAGSDLSDPRREKPPLNPFERDVQRHLEKRAFTSNRSTGHPGT